MGRDTLPRGMSLLALARGGVAVGVPEPASDREPSPASPTRLTASRRTPSEPVRREISERAVHSASAPASRKQKVNARIPAALLDQVRDCVVALSGPPHGMTMDQFAEEAYRRELQRLTREHSSGHTFPARPYDPKPGRRVA